MHLQIGKTRINSNPPTVLNRDTKPKETTTFKWATNDARPCVVRIWLRQPEAVRLTASHLGQPWGYLPELNPQCTQKSSNLHDLRVILNVGARQECRNGRANVDPNKAELPIANIHNDGRS